MVHSPFPRSFQTEKLKLFVGKELCVFPSCIMKNLEDVLTVSLKWKPIGIPLYYFGWTREEIAQKILSWGKVSCTEIEKCLCLHARVLVI